MCVHASFLAAGEPEFLKTKSQATNAQTVDEQACHAYYCMCAPVSPETGGPEFLKTKSRASNAQTIDD